MTRRRHPHPPTAAEMMEKLGATALFIDPKGVPHPVQEEFYRVGTVDYTCGTHECFAQAYLRRKKIRLSPEAKSASVASGAKDFGPWESELILRGWTRGRDCAFTIKQRNKDSLWNVVLAAKARAARCWEVYLEEYGAQGFRNGQRHTITELEHSAEWAGLRPRRRWRRR